MRGLGLGKPNPVGTGIVCDVCLCLDCSGVGGGIGPVSESVVWCYVCVCCESGLFV